MKILSKSYGFSCSHVSRNDDLSGTVDPWNSIIRSIAVLLLTLGAHALEAGQSNIPPNVLFIAIDDMNDWTSYLQGHPQARTPNLDRLAKDSVRFTQAYCNAPSCNPSRASVMLGKHPNSTGFYSNKIGHTSIDLRKYYPDELTIPQFFKQHGYSTFRTGKIYHYWGDWSDMKVKQKDLSFDVHSWGGGKSIEPSTYLCGIDFGWSFTKGGKRSYMDWGAIDAASSKFGEYSRASTVIKEINREHTKPFFAALGFYLPHLPWYYPQEILDEPELAHIRDVADVILPKVLADPPGRDLSDLSNVAVKIASGGLRPRSLDGSRTYKNWHDAIAGEDKWKEAVQAYLASIYFVDQQLGRVLDALEESPNGEHTIIVLWSDHGWMLGEKGAWRKYRPWEDSVKTNFIIKAPGIPALAIDRPVELLSIWPTLTDLAGLPMKDDLDARSLVPLMKNPDMQWDFPVITAHLDESGNGGWQSIRTAKYRYIKYLKTGAEELYDHSNDPNEWTNLIGRSRYRAVSEELSALVPDSMTPLGSWDAPDEAVAEHNRRELH
jgi:arylsulfatase A-like enzyme